MRLWNRGWIEQSLLDVIHTAEPHKFWHRATERPIHPWALEILMFRHPVLCSGSMLGGQRAAKKWQPSDSAPKFDMLAFLYAWHA